MKLNAAEMHHYNNLNFLLETGSTNSGAISNNGIRTKSLFRIKGCGIFKVG